MQNQTNPAEEALDQVVGQFRGEPVTRRQYKAAFERVCAPNWKDPICKTVEVDADPEKAGAELAFIHDAIAFFTGAGCAIYQISMRRYEVRAAGYYRTVGA